MLPDSRKAPSVLLTTSDADLKGLVHAAADAIAVQGDPREHLIEIACARPELPIVVITSVDEQRTLELLALGADEVLPDGSTIQEVAAAVRRVLVRRGRRAAAASALEVRAVAVPSVEPAPRRSVLDTPQLATIARLAGGIAHEFNNLLTVIQAESEHLQQVLDDPEARESAVSIGEAGHRAAALTRQLLAFGRQQTLLPATVSLNDVIVESVPSLRQAMSPRVQITTDLAPDLAQVQIDRSQMGEVLSNLAATAAEAMAQGGTFTLATDMYTVSDEDRRQRPWLPHGRFVRLRVSDTGHGIDQHLLPHLFEPFYPTYGFTGAGLAMSSVYGVVKQSGGFIWADSQKNEGTQVTILLSPLETVYHAAPGPELRRSEIHGARILLVEDTEDVRQTLTGVLELRGFSVVGVPSAEDGLEIAQAMAFDLLLTDVALPGKSGPELAREFRRVSPGTPVLFMSGHSANAIDPGDLDSPRSFLQKPFSGSALVERIHEILGAHPHSNAEIKAPRYQS